MFRAKATGLMLIVMVLILLFSCCYVVREGQQAILLRLGKLTLDPITNKPNVIMPGIHFKLPLLNKVKIFDVRLQTLDIKSSNVTAHENNNLMVSYYVIWNIDNLPRYFTATSGNQFQAETLLEQNLNAVLRKEFMRHAPADAALEKHNSGTLLLKTAAQQSAAGLGIAIQDIRIKSIELSTNATTTIYDKMRAALQQKANKYRAESNAMAETIKATADAKVSLILAKATSDALIVKASGKATAAKIFTDAYSKDPQFFEFYRSLKAYRQIFNNKQHILILNLDSKFFEYFNRYSPPGHKTGVVDI